MRVTEQIIADAKAALSKVGVPEVEVYYLNGRLSAAIEIENGLSVGDLSHILRASAAVNAPVHQEECGNEDAHNSRREDADD